MRTASDVAVVGPQGSNLRASRRQRFVPTVVLSSIPFCPVRYVSPPFHRRICVSALFLFCLLPPLPSPSFSVSSCVHSYFLLCVQLFRGSGIRPEEDPQPTHGTLGASAGRSPESLSGGRAMPEFPFTLCLDTLPLFPALLASPPFIVASVSLPCFCSVN